MRSAAEIRGGGSGRGGGRGVLMTLASVALLASTAQAVTFQWTVPAVSKDRTSYGVLSCNQGPRSVPLRSELTWELAATRRDVEPATRRVLAAGSTYAGTSVPTGSRRLTALELDRLLGRYDRAAMLLAVPDSMFVSGGAYYITVRAGNGAGAACTAFGVFYRAP